jgi:spore maturation protein CgeB
VVSNVLYSDYVKDGVTGLVCKDLSEFDSKLQFLIDHADARRDIGNAAYEDVKINYDLKKIVDIYDKAFKKLMFQNIILPQEVKR